MNKKQRNALITIAIGAIIWFMPVPAGVTVVAWHLAAVFIATVVGFILQPLPIGAVAFIAITFSTLSGLLKVGDALSGYGNSTIWLIVCAFLYSRGFIKSGLGKRIAFGIIKAIGKSALSLGYAIAFSELIISPATPSATKPELVSIPDAKQLAQKELDSMGPMSRSEKYLTAVFLLLFYTYIHTTASPALRRASALFTRPSSPSASPSARCRS